MKQSQAPIPTKDFELHTYLTAAMTIQAEDEETPFETWVKVFGLLQSYEGLTLFCPASTKYHHWWFGGLSDHIAQVMLLMWNMRDMAHVKPWEIVVAAYLHDWEKHWKYKIDKTVVCYQSKSFINSWVTPVFKINEVRFRPSYEIKMGQLLQKHGLEVSQELSNALMLSEGGWSANAKTAQLGPFATVLHSADMLSSHCLGDVKGKSFKLHEYITLEDAVGIQEAQIAEHKDEKWPR